MKKITSFLLGIMMAATLINVTACADDYFALNQTSLSIEQYEQITLIANRNGDIKWTSSDPRLASVEEGVVTSLRQGTVIITATLGDDKAECSISIVPSTKNRSLIVSSISEELQLGQSIIITASVKEDGNDVDANLSWRSDNTDVATVTGGTITAVGRGNTKIIVSAMYKGQNFSREIAIRTANSVMESAVLFMPEADTAGGLLKDYEGDAVAIGFDADTEVTVWENKDLWSSRVWAQQLVAENEYEFLILDIKFISTITEDIIIWNRGTVIRAANGTLDTATTDVVFYNEDGKVYKGNINTEVIYTLVINLTKGGESDAVGIGINTDTSVYIANAVVATFDWYYENYDHEIPKEPDTEGLYIVNGETYVKLEVLTGGGLDGIVKAHYTENAWNDRLIIGRDDITSTLVIGAKYRAYNYYGFDIHLSDANASIIIWTGGYALFVSNDGVITREGGGDLLDDDLIITTSDGAVIDSALEAGVTYTLKIRIQKDNLDNAAFGIAIVGDTDSFFYIGNAFFL